MTLYDLAPDLEGVSVTHQQLTDTATFNEREAAEITLLIQEHLTLAGVNGYAYDTVTQLLDSHLQFAYRAGFARGLQAVTGVTR